MHPADAVNQSYLSNQYTGQYLLVLGTMRTRSSVISHILGSHPEIIGYSERQIEATSTRVYREALLNSLSAEFGWGAVKKKKYALDKVLHERAYVEPENGDTRDIKRLFLLRQPDATIRSIINMSRNITGRMNWSEPVKAIAYYNRQMKYLITIAEQCKELLWLDTDQFLLEPERHLKCLELSLNLNSILEKKYNLFKHTGVPGRGDPSDIIKKGRLQEIQRSSTVNSISLDGIDLYESWELYTVLKNILSRVQVICCDRQ